MNQKFRFTAEPRSALCLLSMALMLLSAAARLWYYLADPVATAMTLSQADIFLLVGLPVFSAALYPVLLALFGRRTIVPLTAPVAGFVVFFLYKALSFSSVLHTVLCSILYLAVLVFFLLTACCARAFFSCCWRVCRCSCTSSWTFRTMRASSSSCRSCPYCCSWPRCCALPSGSARPGREQSHDAPLPA